MRLAMLSSALHLSELKLEIKKQNKVQLFLFREVADTYVGDHLIFTSMGDKDRSANGCWSFVGNVGPQGGKAGQSLNLGGGCLEKEIILHEVLHALGKAVIKCSHAKTLIISCFV